MAVAVAELEGLEDLLRPGAVAAAEHSGVWRSFSSKCQKRNQMFMGMVYLADVYYNDMGGFRNWGCLLGVLIMRESPHLGSKFGVPLFVNSHMGTKGGSSWQ